MTFWRSLLIGVLAAIAAAPLTGLLADARPRRRRLAWLLLLAPYLTPALLTGYGYGNFSLSLVRHPSLNTAFYAGLIWLKFTPVAALALYFAPRPISPAAIHCQKLMTSSRWQRLLFRLRAGDANRFVVAGALVFLFAFSEFEIASMMSVKSWTVLVFDAHAGGLALSASLQRMLGPLFYEAVALTVAVAVLFRQRVVPVATSSARSGWAVMSWFHLIVAAGLVLVLPALVMLRGTIQGFENALDNFAVGREIIASLLFAAGAAFCASLAAVWCGGDSRLRRSSAVVCCLLGLLGPLVLSLVILAVAQWPIVRIVRDTPIPLVIALALVLLPVALVMRFVLAATQPGAALYLTRLMERSRAARELDWRLKSSGKFWTAFLLFGWAYWDLTASAILAPIDMPPVTVRLYNLMHYGQNAALSTMLCAAFAAPLAIMFTVLGTRRWWAR